MKCKVECQKCFLKVQRKQGKKPSKIGIINMTGDERQRNTIAWLFPITQDYIIQLVDEEWTYFYLLLILIKKDK